ncbi:MAG: hypothetical protein K6A98_02425 [Prevotella sp.]|nr:hypothetical protein [Prevotella sp.]
MVTKNTILIPSQMFAIEAVDIFSIKVCHWLPAPHIDSLLIVIGYISHSLTFCIV